MNKKRTFIIFLITLLFITVSAFNNYVISDEVLSNDEIVEINDHLNVFKDKTNIDLYLDVSASDNTDFDILNQNDHTALISINTQDNTWVFMASKNLSNKYSRSKQKSFMNTQKDTLNNKDYVSFVKNLTKDIEKNSVTEQPKKELISIKRLGFSLVGGLLIGLIMAQRNKNKLKTFRARSTAQSYIDEFKVLDQKVVLTNKKESTEYLDKDNQKVSSGKF